MGLMMTDRVLQVLLDRFSELCPPGAAPVDSRIEFQLKLGEAIMRVLRDLGEFIGFHDSGIHLVYLIVLREFPTNL